MYRNAVAASVLAMIVAVAACSAATPADPTGSSPRDVSSSSPTASPSPVYRDTRRLTPGDCFDLIEEADTQEVLAARIRPCDEPHQAEVFGVVEHEAGPDDRFPGEDKLGRDAEDACFDEFSGYVGLSYDFSTLDAAYLMPRPESWAIGDRRITCYVIASPSAPFVESVKDSGE